MTPEEASEPPHWVVAYTDGSGTRGHLPCGAGVVVYDDDPGSDQMLPVAEASRHLGLGTNNHAELSAIRIALYIAESAPFAGRPLLIRSDSEYAINSSRYRGSIDPDRPNARLIMIIRRMIAARRTIVSFEHVDGHAGIYGNERADELANLGRKRRPTDDPPKDHAP